MDWSMIETETAIAYGALAIIILLLLRISAKLGRIASLLGGGRRDAPRAEAKPSADRYMREDTLAEFLARKEQDKS